MSLEIIEPSFIIPSLFFKTYILHIVRSFFLRCNICYITYIITLQPYERLDRNMCLRCFARGSRAGAYQVWKKHLVSVHARDPNIATRSRGRESVITRFREKRRVRDQGNLEYPGPDSSSGHAPRARHTLARASHKDARMPRDGSSRNERVGGRGEEGGSRHAG